MLATPITQGDSPTFRLTVTDASTGDPFDLTGYDIDFYIKRSLQDSDLAAEFHGSLAFSITLAFTLADGQVDVAIPSSVTSNLRLGKLYPFFLRLTNATPDPDLVFISERGQFLAVLPDQE